MLAGGIGPGQRPRAVPQWRDLAWPVDGSQRMGWSATDQRQKRTSTTNKIRQVRSSGRFVVRVDGVFAHHVEAGSTELMALALVAAAARSAGVSA